MNINYSLSPAPGIISDYLIVAIYKASAPSTLVASNVYPAPHVNAINDSFTGLDTDTYYVITYQNSVNVAGGTIRHKFLYDPTWQSATIRLDLVLICGQAGAPTPNTTTFTRNDLAGFQYTVERRGFGSLIQGMDINISNNSQQWDLLTAGDSFGQNEVFIVHFAPQIIITNVPTAASIIAGTSVIIGDGVDNILDSTAPGKVFLLQGTNDTLLITLPDFASIPDNKPMMFLSEGGSHVSATLQCQSGQFIQFLGKQRSKFYFNQGENAWLFKFTINNTGLLYVLSCYGSWALVGMIVDQYWLQNNTSLTGPYSTVFADGSIVSRAKFPKLTEYVLNLPVDRVVSDNTWTTPDGNGKFTNKGKYSLGDGSTTIRLPLLYDWGFLKGVDGINRKAGDFEYPILMDHEHPGTTGSLPDNPFGEEATLRRMGIYAGETTGNVDLTGPPINPDGSPMQTNPKLGAAASLRGANPSILNNNTPGNTGVYKLIIV